MTVHPKIDAVTTPRAPQKGATPSPATNTASKDVETPKPKDAFVAQSLSLTDVMGGQGRHAQGLPHDQSDPVAV